MARPRKTTLSGLTPNTFLLAFTSLFADISTEMLYAVLPVNLTSAVLVASIVAGQLRDRISHPAVFIYGAIFALLGSAALFVLLPVKKAHA